MTAKIGISCQFAALIRILAELIWLRHRGAVDYSAPSVGVYVLGAAIASVLCFVSVMTLWMRRARFSITVAATTILILLAVKVWAVPYLGVRSPAARSNSAAACRRWSSLPYATIRSLRPKIPTTVRSKRPRTTVMASA